MDSSATSSKIRFIDSEGNSISVPAEWQPSLLEIDIDPELWDATVLRVQHALVPLVLRKLGGRRRVVADWPRSGPGRYLIEVLTPIGDSTLSVTILPSKLSISAFSTLLDDLQTRLPASIAIALQRLGGLGGLTILPPNETTLAHEAVRLERAVRGTGRRLGLSSVLLDVASDPFRVLRMEPQWVPREKARRPSPSDLVQVVARQHLLVDDNVPTRIIDRRVEPNVDIYENRLLRLFTNEVQVRLRRLAVRANRSGLDQVRAMADEMLLEMRHARQAARFLDDVTDVTHLPNRVTMVLMNRPAYRAAFEGYLELHRSLAVRLEDERLEAPLENSPMLYQLWGTLEVVRRLAEVAADFGFRLESERIVHRDYLGAYVSVLPAGSVALKLRHPVKGTEVLLVSERSFTGRGRLRSESFNQVPDIVVEVRRPGDPTRLYLFDPKYKLAQEVDDRFPDDGKPKKVDVDKMHAYRDAIRDEHGRRVVESAAILYPGSSKQFGQGIEAIQANPDRTEALQQRVSDILRTALTPARPTILDAATQRGLNDESTMTTIE